MALANTRVTLRPVAAPLTARPALVGADLDFDARDMPRCLVWLSARRVGGVAAGATSAAWCDSSGSGRPGLQATAASRPAFFPGAANGRPALRFDPNDDSLVGALAGMNGAAGAAMIVVSKFNGVGGTRGLADTSISGSTNQALMIFISGASLFARWASGGASYAFADTTSFHVHSFVHTGAGRTLYKDGAAQASETSAKTGIPPTYTVGTLTGTASEANSDITEFVLLGVAPVRSQRFRLDRALGRYYSLPVAA